MSWVDLWRLATAERALAAYRLTFGASLLGRWPTPSLARSWPGSWCATSSRARRFVDALVDFPFALPTAVAGLTLSNLFAENGWLGTYLTPLGIKGAFTPLGVVIALTFVGLPFVVRTLQPVLQNLDRSLEEAAATLGASRWRTVAQIFGRRCCQP